MMKKMMTTISVKIIKSLFIANAVLLVVEFLLFDMKTLLALEIGFVSSSFIILASMKSYQKMVETGVTHNSMTVDDERDTLDKLEDPYALYSKESEDNLKEEKDLVEVVKEERAKLKNGRSVFEVMKDSKPALSLYRLGAYVFLILGFLYLNRQGQLHIITYIVALGVPSVVSVFTLLRAKEECV